MSLRRIPIIPFAFYPLSIVFPLSFSFLLCFVGEQVGIAVGDAGRDINQTGVADGIVEGATEGETEGARLGEIERVRLTVRCLLSWSPFLLFLLGVSFFDQNTEGARLEDGLVVPDYVGTVGRPSKVIGSRTANLLRKVVMRSYAYMIHVYNNIKLKQRSQ